jgi:hypothetical protein
VRRSRLAATPCLLSCACISLACLCQGLHVLVQHGPCEGNASPVGGRVCCSHRLAGHGCALLRKVATRFCCSSCCWEPSLGLLWKPSYVEHQPCVGMQPLAGLIVGAVVLGRGVRVVQGSSPCPAKGMPGAGGLLGCSLLVTCSSAWMNQYLALGGAGCVCLQYGKLFCHCGRRPADVVGFFWVPVERGTVRQSVQC